MFPSLICFQFSWYFLLLLIIYTPTIIADSLYFNCGSNGNLSNFNSFLNSLTSNGYKKGYYTDTVGQINGLVLCRGDVNETTCHSCLTNASVDIVQNCNNSGSGVIWYDYCLLSYSEPPVSGYYSSCTVNSQQVYMYNVANVTNVSLFESQLSLLFNSTIDYAAYSSLNSFATGEVNYTTDSKIYGLVQCLPKLSGDECKRCLQTALDNMPDFIGVKQGARILGVDCNFRYEIYPFFDDPQTLKLPLQENDAVPPSSILNPAPDNIGDGLSATTTGVGVGLGLFFTLMAGTMTVYWTLRKRKSRKKREDFFRQNGGFLLKQQFSSRGANATAKIFTIEELQKATENFSDSHIIGQGGYGTVYKGILPNQQVVAIKKSKLVDSSQIDQFINEVAILSQINHRNIVKLLGCCLETQVPLLVYEFISNGSLHQHIHGDDIGSSLTWEDRLRIAAETAGALAYLHSAASIPIIHRDVKAANILLDKNNIAKIADFGASRSVPFDQTHVTTLVQGTLGYLDPEYLQTSLLTEKSDVYSFGVVLVELLTGEMPVSLRRAESGRNLAAHFVVMVDGNQLHSLVESRILEEAGMEELHIVAQLARKCLYLKGEDRPTMKEVATELEGLIRFKNQHSIHRDVEVLNDV